MVVGQAEDASEDEANLVLCVRLARSVVQNGRDDASGRQVYVFKATSFSTAT